MKCFGVYSIYWRISYFHFVFANISIIQNAPQNKNILYEICENFLAKKSVNIRIVTQPGNDLNLDILKSKAFATFELIDGNKLSQSSLQQSQTSVIFINSMLDFEEISQSLKSDKFDLGGYFLLVVEGCGKIDSDKVFKLSWKRYIYNINILCRDNDTLSIKTFVPFQSDSCGNTTSITVNHLLFESINDFFPAKLNNLHGCPIKLTTFFYPPITMRETLSNGTFRYYGSEMDLMFGLAEALNFSIDMSYLPQSGFVGLLFENGTSTGPLKQTIEGDKDMLMGFYYLTYLRTKYLSFTQSHYSIPLIIMIPLGEPLTAFEKLFKPFQNIVWFFLFFTFGSGVIIIAIINCQKRNIRNFIFGAKIRNPYLNMIIVFVGGSQPKLPKKNFARSLLMMFMLFCLVQRTIYQSSLFLFLQSDGRNPALSTIDEMIEKNFVFYIRETLEHNIRHMNFYHR